METEYAILIQGLKKSFKKLQVLKGIDLTVRRGIILALLGPNGAGKTTTIRILSTLLAPDGGRVLVNGRDVVREAHKVRSQIGLTGQYAAIDEYLTGVENLHMMGRLYHLGLREIRQRSKDLLEIFDLVDASTRPVKTYSGGMRRRLDLAASLIASPPILFLDEPTTGLDPRSRLIMWDIIRQLSAAGTTILLTTQAMEEADHLADRIVVLDNGRIIADGTSDELKERVGTERLEVKISRTEDIEKVGRLIGRDGLHLDAANRTLSMAVRGGAAQFGQVLGRLAGAGIEIENVSLHRPTLDDVFLTFTGRSTEAAEKSS